MQIDAAGLDAGQIEQVIDDGLQSLAILACGKEQVGLLRVERADGLFGAQVNRHVQRGQRGAEFVRHGGDEVVLEFVETEEARDVLKHQGRARHVPGFAVERRRAGQIDALTLGRGHPQRVLEAFGTVGATAAQDVSTQAIDERADSRIDFVE